MIAVISMHSSHMNKVVPLVEGCSILGEKFGSSVKDHTRKEHAHGISMLARGNGVGKAIVVGSRVVIGFGSKDVPILEANAGRGYLVVAGADSHQMVSFVSSVGGRIFVCPMRCCCGANGNSILIEGGIDTSRVQMGLGPDQFATGRCQNIDARSEIGFLVILVDLVKESSATCGENSMSCRHLGFANVSLFRKGEQTFFGTIAVRWIVL